MQQEKLLVDYAPIASRYHSVVFCLLIPYFSIFAYDITSKKILVHEGQQYIFIILFY